MIPLQLIGVDFKRLWLGSIILISVIATIVAFGLFITLQERALREGSARAAEQFDLIIGAAGSETQLVLSTVYLQASPLPLLNSRYLEEVQKNPLVAWAAPIALGDSYFNSPIIGTTLTLLTQHGKVKLTTGRLFTQPNEAVVGANSNLKIGHKITPMHGQVGQFDAHAHQEVNYTVVGILPANNNAWDNAIFVPIEAVWQIHGLGDAHHQDNHVHQSPPISAIIVKPKSFAGAYQLRSQYRKELTQAVFPAEVLTKLYGTLGNIQQLLNKMSLASQLLVALLLIMMAVIYLNFKKQQIAILRAFGANRHRIFLLIWLGFMLLVSLGIVIGLAIGYVVTLIVSNKIALQQGFQLPVSLQWQDIYSLLVLLLALSISLLIPALLSYRYTVASCFKS